jgi:peptidoglycan hydrolase-like protein with peptidoglycan-binding domain
MATANPKRVKAQDQAETPAEADAPDVVEARRPQHPGPLGFYSGATGPWLSSLRERLNISTDAPDFREEDRQGILAYQERCGVEQTGYLTRIQWRDLFYGFDAPVPGLKAADPAPLGGDDAV